MPLGPFNAGHLLLFEVQTDQITSRTWQRICLHVPATKEVDVVVISSNKSSPIVDGEFGTILQLAAVGASGLGQTPSVPSRSFEGAPRRARSLHGGPAESAVARVAESACCGFGIFEGLCWNKLCDLILGLKSSSSGGGCHEEIGKTTSIGVSFVIYNRELFSRGTEKEVLACRSFYWSGRTPRCLRSGMCVRVPITGKEGRI